MDAKKTGRFICENRKKHGMSQRELADQLNITDKAISKWERGISFPDISMLIPLSETLEISLYDLLTGGENDEQAGC
ncbi:MAG: helix-turn-helix domain-containing protein [Oscillospiraceae bacterium]|nr:helix-turn-helix domain-containing protein [Oscillospiraceae bacterium]